MNRGFTLIEVLVVLMIMGLFVGMISAVVQPNDRDLLQLEAGRLARLLDLAAAEARLTGSPVAWTADTEVYRFWGMAADGTWSVMQTNDLLRPRSLPPDMKIEALYIENSPVQRPFRIEFPSHATITSFRIDMRLGAERSTVTSSPIGELRVVAGEGRL
ncbi:MAG: GspH/FimT family pseudopilin [Gammaproteobacteria bacterium]